MAELKVGGSDVVKIMYGSQEIGGTAKLEPGTILYMSDRLENNIKNLHLLSTTKNWNNIDGINVGVYNNDPSSMYGDVNISGDDFKNLDIKKRLNNRGSSSTMNISTSIVDGEYRLNINNTFPSNFVVKAI